MAPKRTSTTKNAIYQRKRYAELKRRGICVHCGEAPRRKSDKADAAICEQCASDSRLIWGLMRDDENAKLRG